MLKELPRTEPTAASDKRYYSIADLVARTGAKHNALYHFIKKTHLKQVHLPTEGSRLFLAKEDAEMVVAVFTNPEDYAQPVNS